MKKMRNLLCVVLAVLMLAAMTAFAWMWWTA